MNLANATATYNFFRAFARKGMFVAAWGSVGANLLMPFDRPPYVDALWSPLVDLIVALLFVGLIKWQRRDFSLTGGWVAAALYVALYAFMSPGSAVLVTINTGFAAAIGDYVRSRPDSFVYFASMAVVANLATAAASALRKRAQTHA